MFQASMKTYLGHCFEQMLLHIFQARVNVGVEEVPDILLRFLFPFEGLGTDPGL